MVFLGHSEHAIDAKNRVAIPAKFRNQIDPERDGRALVLVPGEPSTTLWLYPQKIFERLTSQGTSELIPDDDQLAFDQGYFPWAELVDMDAQGRVVLPEELLKSSGLHGEIIICGVRDHLEIRPKDGFPKSSQSFWEHYREFRGKAREAYRQHRRQSGPETGNS